MMRRLRAWVGMVLCCLPGMAIALILGAGMAMGRAAFGFLDGGPTGKGGYPMEPTTLLLLAAALACPIGMGLTMWMMNRNMGAQHSQSTPSQAEAATLPDAERLGRLREQRQRLEEEISETEKTVALQAQKETLRGHQ